MTDNKSSNGGIGFFGALTILFIGLKLGHVIDWEWVWVLAPAWGSLGLALVIVMIVVIFS